MRSLFSARLPSETGRRFATTYPTRIFCFCFFVVAGKESLSKTCMFDFFFGTVAVVAQSSGRPGGSSG